jgi:cytochrome c-type biogenesis protein CcmH/NrfF
MARHSADFVSLTFGILFAAVGVVLLLGRLDTIRLDWVIPAATVVLGVLLIVLARPTRSEPDDEPTDA